MKNTTSTPPKNLLCFSHLRWDFVFQRPQHLLSRFAKATKVYFFEEPIFDATEPQMYLSISKREQNLHVLVPHLSSGLNEEQVTEAIKALLDKFLADENMDNWMFWFYTPMAFSFAGKHKPKLIIYDCMDELSAFKFAPEALIGLEKKLMARADLVFTGGHSLYEAKKQQHANIYPFPSSIEKEHFAKARSICDQPADQASIQGVKIGFFGVIDERFDVELIRGIAEERPEWNIMLIGPVVKISQDSLPKNPNIHYLGQKTYQELPAYLSGWNVALIPFQLNESTRFISPTKTPEYLAAGVPVVSAPIRDVIKPYGIKKLVHVGASHLQFIAAIETELAVRNNKPWLAEVDSFLKDKSWDNTYLSMMKHIHAILNSTDTISIAS